jgi:hypothetical protein
MNLHKAGKLEAVRLSDCWLVRPAGQCGTMGWHPVAWESVAAPLSYRAGDAIDYARGYDSAGEMLRQQESGS